MIVCRDESSLIETIFSLKHAHEIANFSEIDFDWAPFMQSPKYQRSLRQLIIDEIEKCLPFIVDVCCACKNLIVVNVNWDKVYPRFMLGKITLESLIYPRLSCSECKMEILADLVVQNGKLTVLLK